MNFVLKPPSLEHRALVKMAVSLWNQNDVGALLSLVKVNEYRAYLSPLNEEWKEIEARVLERVAQLSLPQLLNEKLSCFIHIIGLEIYKWIQYFYVKYHLPLNLPLELCWTPQGTVDRKRTTEVLVRDESLDLSTRYKLACVCCLEDSIMALWNTLSEDIKESLLGRDSLNIVESGKEWIIVFWSRTMKGRGLGHACISYKDGFVNCAREGHKEAAEYFLQKLSPREREECLVETAKRETDADTLCFLLSEMEEDQQMKVFKGNPHRVLLSFLQWPWQSFFMEIANCMWDFLPKRDYDSILTQIISNVRGGYKDWNYPKLFGEFWRKSPDALKSFIRNDLDKGNLLSYLFASKNKEIVQLILQDATPTAREKLVYSYQMHIFCKCAIRDDKWDYLEFCIRECFPSKDLMSKFKEKFQNRKKGKSVEDDLVRKRHKWDKLFLLSDDSLREYEKRSDDEGESSSSKRFRSLQ